MKIYNTMTKKKEEFVPLTPGKVLMYVCGPTVYNFIHIGNARPMIFFDTVRRYFTYRGYEVRYVSNFTDVDDKIIQKAKEEGTDASAVAKRYIAECQKDMAGMNVLPATVHPLATREIDGMVDMIQKLIHTGYAYEKNGSVYYRTRRFKGYGKLSHKNLDDLRSGFRSLKVTGEEEKEDPLDFVLWKPKKEGEPFWPSPWSDGRPGWHIECSVMSSKYLGVTIDIHAGGEDLIFPHHENEIAQSEGCFAKPFARYWMHNAFLNIDKHKMSKSLNNFFTVRDISKDYDLQYLRFFTLTAHYRTPLEFSHNPEKPDEDSLLQAKTALTRIRTAYARVTSLLEAAAQGGKRDEETADKESLTHLPAKEPQKNAAAPDAIDGFIKAFENAMEDDFNTADALAAVFDLTRFANKEADGQSPKAFLRKLKETFETLCGVLGLTLAEEEKGLDAETEALIAKREEARKAKDYQKADAIRETLLQKGIILKDTREGVQWQRA